MVPQEGRRGQAGEAANPGPLAQTATSSPNACCRLVGLPALMGGGGFLGNTVAGGESGDGRHLALASKMCGVRIVVGGPVEYVVRNCEEERRLRYTAGVGHYI